VVFGWEQRPSTVSRRVQILTGTHALELQRASWPALMNTAAAVRRCGLARAEEEDYLTKLTRVAEDSGGAQWPSRGGAWPRWGQHRIRLCPPRGHHLGAPSSLHRSAPPAAATVALGVQTAAGAEPPMLETQPLKARDTSCRSAE
jgi:hypothetical protein